MAIPSRPSMTTMTSTVEPRVTVRGNRTVTCSAPSSVSISDGTTRAAGGAAPPGGRGGPPPPHAVRHRPCRSPPARRARQASPPRTPSQAEGALLRHVYFVDDAQVVGRSRVSVPYTAPVEIVVPIGEADVLAGRAPVLQDRQRIENGVGVRS